MIHLDTVVLGVIHHSAGQSVEADKVCQLAGGGGVLNNIALNDSLLRNEPVQNIRRGEYWSKVKVVEIAIEEGGDRLHVLCLELSDPRGLGGIRQFVKFEMSLHSHVPREVTELHLNQLLGVDGPVPIAARPDRLWQDDTRSVNRLQYVSCHYTCLGWTGINFPGKFLSNSLSE